MTHKEWLIEQSKLTGKPLPDHIEAELILDELVALSKQINQEIEHEVKKHDEKLKEFDDRLNAISLQLDSGLC